MCHSEANLLVLFGIYGAMSKKKCIMASKLYRHRADERVGSVGAVFKKTLFGSVEARCTLAYLTAEISGCVCKKKDPEEGGAFACCSLFACIFVIVSEKYCVNVA